jgi:flavin-dependent dehydrogenase
MPAQPDVLVVGGGPAGSAAAFKLAKDGYAVTLVDRARFPRETVGESLLPSVWPYLDEMGLSERVVAEGFVPKAGGVVAWGDKLTEISFRDFAYDRPGLHVERDAFDALLLEAARGAGVCVREACRAETFTPPAEGERGEVQLVGEDGARTRVRPRMLIDASGQAGFLSRLNDWRRLDPDFRFVSLWGYFEGSRYVGAGGIVRTMDAIRTHPPMTFVTRLTDWGWAWHIPMRRLTSVGINAPVDLYKAEIGDFASAQDYFLAVLARTRPLAGLLADAKLGAGGVRAIRDYSYATQTIAGPGFFIAGDAAGFVDPIFSLGVVLALYSARLAAWATDRTLRNPAQAARNRALYVAQLSGRYQLARAMALPSDKAAAGADAHRYFNFFSESEKELMWSAASMTTRSVNVALAAGDAAAPKLRRRELETLQFS